MAHSVGHPFSFVWISPLHRTYRVRRQPIIHDLPNPLPRSEQYPDYAPLVTIDENWPILYRLPKPDSHPRPRVLSTPTNRRLLNAWLARPHYRGTGRPDP